MAAPDILLIVPTSAGVRAVVNGLEIYRPLSARQLLDMSIRFAEAAAERVTLDAEATHADRPRIGSWCPKATDALR